jgi:hypothetical protein
MHTKFWSENPKGRDKLENLSIDGKENIKINLKGIGWKCVDWIHLAQNRDPWWLLVNIVINL